MPLKGDNDKKIKFLKFVKKIDFDKTWKQLFSSEDEDGGRAISTVIVDSP